MTEGLLVIGAAIITGFVISAFYNWIRAEQDERRWRENSQRAKDQEMREFIRNYRYHTWRDGDCD